MDAARRANRFGWDGNGGPMTTFTPAPEAPVSDTPAPSTLNPADVRKGLARLLPVLETVARVTPNKFDDAAVAFLKLMIADPQRVASVVVW